MFVIWFSFFPPSLYGIILIFKKKNERNFGLHSQPLGLSAK